MSLADTLRNITNKVGTGGQHTIDDFKATIGKRGGIARQNRFVVIMTPPGQTFVNKDWNGILSSALSGNLGFNDLVNDPRDIAILCESCSFPGKTINTIEYEREGFRNQVKIPYSYTNEDVTFGFHLTNDYYMKKLFDKWLNVVMDQQNHVVNYRETYARDVIIQQLDQQNNPTYGLKLLNAFPTAVNSVTLDNGASDALQKLSVTMSYDEYIPESGIANIISGAKGFLDGLKNIF